MPDQTKKTLRLPTKEAGSSTPPPAPGPRRKPVRGGALRSHKPVAKPAVEAQATERTENAAPARAGKPERSAERKGKVYGERPAPRAEKPVPRTNDNAPPARARSESAAPKFRSAKQTTESPVNKASTVATAPSQMAQTGVRVSKLMAEQGLCSRREADAYIERGWVYVDGQRITELGTRVDPEAKITLDKEARATQQRQMTILLHKPVGYVSGQPEPGFIPAVTLIKPENQYRTPDTPIFHATHLKGLAPAGRLDIDSTGLLILTQDGRVARSLIGERSTVDKEYLVRVEGQLDEKGLKLLNYGLSLDDKKLKPAKVERLNEDQLRFVLNEGRKRQIRRMCELVGLHVIGLKRVRIGKVRLADLPVGQWRYLRDGEMF